MTVNFETTSEESQIIDKIAERALKMQPKYHKMDYIMDIKACHLNGNPLRLQELLEADDFNFAHDVFGIGRHIDTDTGQLMNCFLPRYSA